jgi:hypothetical protein
VSQRRELLRELIPDDGSIQYSDHFVASGKEIFNAVKELGLEGMNRLRKTRAVQHSLQAGEGALPLRSVTQLAQDQKLR